MDFVSVFNAGNSNDPTTGYGAVDYNYSIGKYEVTLYQYAAFLNAVAATDTYALYNPAMATDLNIAGISRSGSSGSYTYSVIGDGNRPVTYVSWFDAARFANWLHNGRSSGAQTPATTEDGAYTLLGATSGVGISKNLTARYWVPSENEWYKAAYHQPASQGGDSDDYWLYPTASNVSPNSRNGSSTDANSANFFLDDGIANGFNGGYAVSQATGYSSSQQYLTPVGAFTLARSFYGTFDQGGNVWEWNDTINVSTRGFRGGSWGDGTDASLLRSSALNSGLPTYESVTVGFRMAVAVSPLITQQPQSQAVSISNNATFTVIAVGVNPLAYQWRFNNAVISGATNTSLSISNTALTDQGNYTVVITNSYGSVTSSVAVLTVAAAPSLSPLPTNVVYGTGGTTLTVSAIGSAPLTYQWQLNGTNISGATGASYMIPGSATNAGSYTVVVSNAYGTNTSGTVSAYFFGDLKFYAGITLGGTIGTTYRVDYANALTGPTNWLLLTNLVLPYSPYLVIDPTSPGQGQRFYRAEQQ